MKPNWRGEELTGHSCDTSAMIGTARRLPKPISRNYRFRRDPDSDTGLGGVPLFQTF